MQENKITFSVSAVQKMQMFDFNNSKILGLVADPANEIHLEAESI